MPHKRGVGPAPDLCLSVSSSCHLHISPCSDKGTPRRPRIEMTSWSFATANCRRRRGAHNKPSSVDTKDTSAGSGPSGPLNNKLSARAALFDGYCREQIRAEMQGALVQASCGHRLERSDQGAGRQCDGCYASCPDTGATQWYRCTEGGCDFDLCGSCHANGYPSAGHLRPVACRWSVEHTSAAFLVRAALRNAQRCTTRRVRATRGA